jgi:hypothetical protein
LKDGLELPLKLLLTPPDTLIFPIKKKTNLLSQFKLLEINHLMKNLKSLDITMMEFSEKTPNGSLMDQVLPPLLMPSILDYLIIIFIIVKLILIPLFLELLVSTMLNLPLEPLLTVLQLLIKNLIIGIFVLLMEPLPVIGFALFLKS